MSNQKYLIQRSDGGHAAWLYIVSAYRHPVYVSRRSEAKQFEKHHALRIVEKEQQRWPMMKVEAVPV